MEYEVIPFAEERHAQETADETDGGVTIRNSRTGHLAAAVPTGTDHGLISRSPVGSEKLEIEEATRSFEDYLADEYGYDPRSPLWEADVFDNSADVEKATSFFHNFSSQFQDDPRVQVEYARIDDDDGDLYIGISEAQ